METQNTDGAVLALDLGTYCGWARRDVDGSVQYGEQPFKKQAYDSEGKRIWRFMQWLRLQISTNNVQFLAFEDVQFQSTQAQTRLWSGWLTVTLLTAEYARIPCKGFPVGTVKLTASGNGHAGKKRMQYAAMSIYNLDTLPGEDEADALCVLRTAELWRSGKLVMAEKKKKPRKSKKKPPATQGQLL